MVRRLSEPPTTHPTGATGARSRLGRTQTPTVETPNSARFAAEGGRAASIVGCGIAAVHTDTGVLRVFVVGDDGLVRIRRARGSGWDTPWLTVDGITLDPTSSLAAACVDGDGVVLSASLSDGMVLRCYLGPEGPLTDPQSTALMAERPGAAAVSGAVGLC